MTINKTKTLEANEVNDKFQLKFIEHWIIEFSMFIELHYAQF